MDMGVGVQREALPECATGRIVLGERFVLAEGKVNLERFGLEGIQGIFGKFVLFKNALSFKEANHPSGYFQEEGFNLNVGGRGQGCQRWLGGLLWKESIGNQNMEMGIGLKSRAEALKEYDCAALSALHSEFFTAPSEIGKLCTNSIG